MRHETHDTDGTGDREHEVYDMAPDPEYWPAVTSVACPVAGCPQTVVWHEAGYVPGYRVCAQHVVGEDYDEGTVRHRFLARADARAPTLVRCDQP